MQNITPTSQKPISPRGVEKSTYSQAAFPASHFPSQDSERERKMTATSGRKCYEQYGKYSPLGSLVKTLLESSRWYNPARRLRWVARPLFSERITLSRKCTGSMSSKPSVQTSNVRDIPSGRFLFRLVPSEHHTAGTGCGLSQGVLLPTPCAQDGKNSTLPPSQEKRCSLIAKVMQEGILPTPQTQGLKRCNADGKTEFMPLGLLPTPTSIDSGSGRINKSLSPNAKKRPTIALAAKMGLLPTPMSTDIHHAQRVEELKRSGKSGLRCREKGRSGANGLMDYLDFHGLLITPSASDGLRSGFTMGTHKETKENGNLSQQIAHKIGGGTSQLNPLFVQEMMGFPYLWTELPFQSGDKNP